VVGDGDALKQIKDLAVHLGVDDKIDFIGWVSGRSEYVRYLNSAEICISPEPATTYNAASTFIKIMDYMEAGKPIVAFDLKETRYSAGDAALYAPSNDELRFAQCLTTLMDFPQLRTELGRHGEDRIREELGWEYSVPHLLQAYRTCLSMDH